MTSVLESQRHPPELIGDDQDALKSSREFVGGWAVNDAIQRGELSTDAEVDSLVEMLVAVMWGGWVSTPGSSAPTKNSRPSCGSSNC